MEPKIPKKRGRKKKIQTDSFANIEASLNKKQLDETIKEIFSNNSEPSKATQESIEKKIQEIKARAAQINKVYEEKQVFYSFSRKVRDIYAPRNIKNDTYYCKKYRMIYENIKRGQATEDEKTKWGSSISFKIAENLGEIVSYLLMLGPLSASESDILAKASSLFQYYYLDKLHILQLNPECRQYYLREIFVPSKESAGHSLLSELIAPNSDAKIVSEENMF
ncbi:hypothetical protein ENBRE01_0236 [Enteropsectra breve]|nr:hypothetical protein ENBRE01_0236 [Enteropsectra breve]